LEQAVLLPVNYILLYIQRMSESRIKFDKAVWKTVSSIKSGRVMSYGQVARISGYPGRARMVSKAMKRSADPLPWHRVVKSDRTLAFEIGSETFNKQKELLEKEGVRFIAGKVVPVDAYEVIDLDELLWGPPE
jgi:methylated-DNA-protein-cysteine methyltransferase-like protein